MIQQKGEGEPMFAHSSYYSGYILSRPINSGRRMALRRALLGACAALATAGVTAPAAAQNQRAERVATAQEVIVTARKREESALKVPVIENVLTRETIERTAIANLEDVAHFAPGLVIGQAQLSTGALASIRGFGTFALNPGVDNSV